MSPIPVRDITLHSTREQVIPKNPHTFITKQLVIDLKCVSKQDNFFSASSSYWQAEISTYKGRTDYFIYLEE